MQNLNNYYKLEEDEPTILCSSFESVQHFVAKSILPQGSRVTITDMARVELVTLYHHTGHEIECVTLDGEVIGTWREPLPHPITEYFGAPPMGGDQ